MCCGERGNSQTGICRSSGKGGGKRAKTEEGKCGGMGDGSKRGTKGRRRRGKESGEKGVWEGRVDPREGKLVRAGGGGAREGYRSAVLRSRSLNRNRNRDLTVGSGSCTGSGSVY